MKKHMVYLLVLLFFAVSQSSVLAIEPITVRVSHFPPYYYKDTTGNWTGQAVEITNAVVAAAGYEIEYLELPRKRAFDYIKRGKIDLMLNLTPTKEREEFLDFIGISSYEQIVLFVAKEHKDIEVKSIDDLGKFDKKFGLQKNYYYPQLTERLKQDKAFDKNFDYILEADLNIRKTLGKRIIGFFEDKMFGLYAINNRPDGNSLTLHSFSLNDPQPVYIAAGKIMDIKKRDRLRSAHLQLSEQGEIRAIIEKWTRTFIDE